MKTNMFTVGGVSKRNGTVKVRFCSDFVLRIKNLQKQGDTDIKLIELPHPMSKTDVCKFLLTLEEFKIYEKDIMRVAGKKAFLNTPTKQKITPPLNVVDNEVEDIKKLITA